MILTKNAHLGQFIQVLPNFFGGDGGGGGVENFPSA